ncbi:hypothetical protein L484_021496 [Morus notabilis]|uniref:Uncharacterized protein n=1 Tax=Morus notabilis TaxID=981085 RepID=W9T0D0_9ROSA|nr:hypothetical protein L484_021496 [Morus notabilis]
MVALRSLPVINLGLPVAKHQRSNKFGIGLPEVTQQTQGDCATRKRAKTPYDVINDTDNEEDNQDDMQQPTRDNLLFHVCKLRGRFIGRFK